MDWSSLFGLQMPVAELILRGSAIYWFLFLVFRFLLRRDVGAVGVADVLLLVLIADAAQNAMAGEYKTITEGLILISTILGWNYLIDWLAHKYRWVERFAVPRSVVVVRNGAVLRRNLSTQLMSLDDLKGQLRLQGIEKLSEVKVARIEEDGQISVIRARKSSRSARRERSQPT